MDSKTILRRDIAATVALFAFVGGTVAVVNVIVPDTATVPSTTVEESTTLDACTTDGPSLSEAPCHWNASEQGNGQGVDFILEEDGSITYP